MKIITDDECGGYFRAGHPDRPARVLKSIERLKAQTDLALAWGVPGPIEDEALLRAHSPELLARLRQTEDFDADTPYHEGIDGFARASAGAALESLRCARGGETAFSLMRPPGHHATPRRAMGFCYLNNAAIAALAACAEGVSRVAVFDFDVHHGNGTEDILKGRRGIEFFSIHQFPCYPGTGLTNIGGNCFNYPVPPRTPRDAYRSILASALARMKQFKPGLLVVSAGFDAYARDPLAEETLEAEDFHWLGENLRSVAVPTVSLLEGGYSSDLPELILAYLKGLEGKT